ncbi:MAG: hypothetical protein ACOX8X_01665 [Methanomethylophilus sp.]
MARRKKKDDLGEQAEEATVSFLGGLLFTILLIVVVPVICNYYIQPVVEDAVGDTAFMWFSSSLIVTIIMLAVMLVFMYFLGAGAILNRFGIIGVIALIVAYYLMDDLPGAILPVACLIVMWAIKAYKGRGKKKSKKKKH